MEESLEPTTVEVESKQSFFSFELLALKGLDLVSWGLWGLGDTG